MLTSTPNHPLLEKFETLREYRFTKRPHGKRRRSAVLIPVLRGTRPTLLYTLRAKHLKHHAGQVSFPGGRIEPLETGWDAAVREAEEEIGLGRHLIEPVGRLDDVYSPRGYHIECHVGFCQGFVPLINKGEVECMVEVGLEELFDPDLHRVQPWGNRYRVHYFDFREGLVWGVTGEITDSLRRILQPEGECLNRPATPSPK